MKIFVFDLDFTLWNAGGTWCDATNPPYFWNENKLMDQSGRWIRLYPEVKKILDILKQHEKYIVAASRTFEPEWAKQLLQFLEIECYFDLMEIYPGSKIQHFKNIQRHFNILYTNMVFFDDEYRNIKEIKNLGVESVLVQNGISMQHVEKYLYH